MNSKKIRQTFIQFFQNRYHKNIPSSSVVPLDDPSLLFTNAGMNQFKPIFLDELKTENKRVVNSQKCIRVSGKHNDLEEVGIDSFHHTFFEMLGNWSFGDYYKKDAIKWSWELFTKEWKLDKRRLWVTVYEEDIESYNLWKSETDISNTRVLKSGKKDNFWEMGDTGPCGPCSEIHYYVGDDLKNQKASGVNESDEYWELWNLVFIQNNRLKDGSLSPLPNKHIDTGAGLERIAAVLQGKKSNYDTDLFKPIIEKLSEISKKSYKKNPIPHNVIADHIRMLCFSIADGAIPSNDGRGYVLRRILRRASRFGRKIDLKDPFLFKLVPIIGELMGDIYPEVLEKQNYIQKVIKSEELSFNKTLDRGLIHFEKIISNKKVQIISGDESFKLYDTYGFPIDLTQLLAKERNLEIDLIAFENLMSAQKLKAKKSGKFKVQKENLNWEVLSDDKDSIFLGYDTLESVSNIMRYTKTGDSILLILDKTPFYAESGGQVGDIGIISGQGFQLDVINVIKDNNSIIHVCEGDFIKPSKVKCEVDSKKRSKLKRNHTATHLLHKALKIVLGDHVNQAGSLVESDYLRFDLTHFNKVTIDEIIEIENLVNYEILENHELLFSLKSFKDAKKDGAEALFGEKYDEEVRVVQVGDFSMELCGGTHVKRTGDIGSFKIIEESSLSSGVRRMVAVTGNKSIHRMQKNDLIINKIQNLLNIAPNKIISRIDDLLSEKKKLEKELKQNINKNHSFNFSDKFKKVGDHSFLIENLESSQIDLRIIGDQIYGKLRSGIAVVFNQELDKTSAVVIVSEDLNKIGIIAGKLAKDIGGFMGGGGGGKSHLATAGGKKGLNMKKIIDETEKLVLKKLKG